MINLQDTFTLSNGVKIPCIGYGTWQAPSGEIAAAGVENALKLGYRHIDAAAGYNNEDSVGEGIIKSGIKREDIFVTSKVKNTDRGYETTKAAFYKTLEDLKLDYLDLYLIHWPASFHRFENWEEINIETWRAMTELYKEGKIKAIGVCNFMEHHLKALMETEVKPMINQIEFNPGFKQEALVNYCKDNNILVEAWSPLGSGRVLNKAELIDLAKKYNKSVAQICVRFSLQNEILPLPKSVTPERIKENSEVFDFEISNEDMKFIKELGEFGNSGSHPDKVDW